MLRVFIGALARKATCQLLQKNVINPAVVVQKAIKPSIQCFSTLPTTIAGNSTNTLLGHPKISEIARSIPSRNLTKYSLKQGKRKSVKVVLRRFYRLNWGIWIRTKCGRNKKLWKKTSARKRRLRRHVFCNATQSMLLDKMVGNYWRSPKYYVDDPYEPYHTREEFHFTRITPKPFVPKENL